MNEFEHGINLFMRLPKELQRVIKQQLLKDFWVGMKQRSYELLDDKPFYNIPGLLFPRKFSVTDQLRIFTMSEREFFIEFRPLHIRLMFDEG